MNLQELHDAHARRGHDPKDDLKYGLAAMKWHGWGSPVGLGLFLLSIGGVIYLLHLSGLVG